MKLPARTAGPNEVIRVGREHLDRMAAVPELAPQAQRLAPVQSEYVTSAEEWTAALSAVRTAATVREQTRRALEDLVRIALVTVRNKTRRRRKPGLKDPCFPEGITPFLLNNATLIRNVEVLLAKIGDESDPSIHALVDPLETAMNQAKEAELNLDASRTAARTARGALEVTRRKWDLAYRRDYFDLTILYTGVRGRAEMFFWRAAPALTSESAPALTSESVPALTGESAPVLTSPTVPALAASSALVPSIGGTVVKAPGSARSAPGLDVEPTAGSSGALPVAA
jgi:hypothetical protein